MSTFKVLFTLFLCLVVTEMSMAQTKSCALCNMEINDNAFRAEATSGAGNPVSFDAIECLVNYLKTKDQNSFSKLSVTDYTSGRFIDATKAYHLKSKDVPSLMEEAIPLYQNYNGIFMDEDWAVNIAVRYIVL
ncbi:nitrous oxide reductase accessory protein NosL [Muriicola sp. Z0-33]|uniref:nitrous oxide reductase accessory protein NosL n=1 Tax=Muriicola sp. Z0-33 TaxID=2816957 RepID=UPI00223900DE|nr:nitrous oxide reductase accessory protein NosL [Muriicola sp. Z0-33]MCW5517179.1 nitrous oxide reductase accessory protein NosL [Muriicola sp. Z0-33]